MISFLLAAALSVSAPAEAGSFSPPVVLTMDPAKDKPILCAKQFLINRERVAQGLPIRDDLLEAYAASTKMTVDKKVELINQCDVFAIGALFGMTLATEEVEEVVKSNAPLTYGVIEASSPTP